mmetsp:Transcript_25827/g.73446  ORF Transcript_25827/g.73446 Transcript_25827/m.73446 type:complete len:607 (-) Transcript_25827:343-2163(-)
MTITGLSLMAVTSSLSAPPTQSLSPATLALAARPQRVLTGIEARDRSGSSGRSSPSPGALSFSEDAVLEPSSAKQPKTPKSPTRRAPTFGSARAAFMLASRKAMQQEEGRVESFSPQPLTNEALEEGLRSSRWDAVCIQGFEVEQLQGRSFGDPSPDSLATVVLLESAPRDIVPAIVAHVLDAGYRRPIIAALVGEEEALQQMAQVGADDVARNLLHSGFDDVVLSVRNAAMLRLSVSTSMARLAFFDTSKVQMALEVQDLERRLEENESSSKEPWDSLFWRSAHRLFKGFPRLDEALVGDPADGDTMGSLEIMEQLGKGGQAFVFVAKNKMTETSEALKFVYKDALFDTLQVQSLWQEMWIMSNLDHPNIVSLLGVFHSQQHICLRLELVGQVNLWGALNMAGGRFGMNFAQRFEGQVVSAIAHCHRGGIAHRDVKPENVVVSDALDQVKLVDFGSATTESSSWARAQATPTTQQVQVADEDNLYDPRLADVFSCGVLLLEMLCGCGKLNKMLAWREVCPKPCPERRKEVVDYFRRPDALRNALRKDLDDVSEDLFRLLNCMLDPDATSRWQASAALSSAWFQIPLYDSDGQDEEVFAAGATIEA